MVGLSHFQIGKENKAKCFKIAVLFKGGLYNWFPKRMGKAHSDVLYISCRPINQLYPGDLPQL